MCNGKAMCELKITLLGTLVITVNDEPIEVVSNFVRALLLYLAVENDRPHRRDVLAELLWPDKPQGVARNSLKQALSNLRTALGECDNSTPLLIASRDEIQINQSSPYWIDTDEFSSLIKNCETHTHTRLSVCAVCEANLLHAIEFWRGDFLADFHLPENQDFNNWIIIKREVFQRQMAEALSSLSLIYEARGEYAKAGVYCRQLTELEPWSEKNHRNLMRILALSGRRSAALRQYQICRESLKTELDVEPSNETVTLYEKIKAWEPGAFSIDDPLQIFDGKTNSQFHHAVDSAEKTAKYRKFSFGNIAFLIIMIGVLGFGLIYWLSTRMNSQAQIPVGSEAPPVPTEVENNQPATHQSIAPTVPKQTLPANSSTSGSSNPEIELQALVTLFEKTDGTNWANSDGWLSDRSYCIWYGVTCRGEKIVKLDLSHNQLNGSIPPDISQLEYLENLDLGNNELKGNIPPELGNLSRLKQLTLWGNRELSGPIPPELGNLSNLEFLELAHWESGGSLLSGEIPPELGKLKKLRSLNISVSLLRGPLPVELCSLTNLESIALDSNQLSGTIPPEIGNLVNLTFLDLGGNDINGPIPPELGKLSRLNYFALGGSLVSGEIPDDLGNLVRLRYLVLDSTNLSGPLPPTLMNLNLRELTYFGTDVCEPPDEAFQTWLKSINEMNSSGIPCEP